MKSPLGCGADRVVPLGAHLVLSQVDSAGRVRTHLCTAGLRCTPKTFVLSRRKLGIRKVIDIATSDGTLIAGGFLS